MKEFPGVSVYPVDAWEEAGCPMLIQRGWLKMCVRIAQKNVEDRHTIFEAAEKLGPVVAREASDRSATPPPPPLAAAASSNPHKGC